MSDEEFLDERTLNNAGAATLGSDDGGYGLFLSSGATFDNEFGASLDLTSDPWITERRRDAVWWHGRERGDALQDRGHAVSATSR